MNENKERNLTLIESTKSETSDINKVVEKNNRHTNPIAKKFLDFHREKISKFSVKDLFQK